MQHSDAVFTLVTGSGNISDDCFFEINDLVLTHPCLHLAMFVHVSCKIFALVEKLFGH